MGPALQIEGAGLNFSIKSMNDRGTVLISIISEYLMKKAHLFTIQNKETIISGNIIASNKYFSEEERSKQSSLFTLIREIREIFDSPYSSQLGLYGSFGYDLTFQFENIVLKKDRDADQRDIVLYFPDEILIVDNQKNDAWKVKYDFSYLNQTTIGKSRTPTKSLYKPYPLDVLTNTRDYTKGDYSQQVIKAKEQFKCGNLFEVVLSQAFREKMTSKPSDVFKRLCKRNPSPYGFFMNLGK